MMFSFPSQQEAGMRTGLQRRWFVSAGLALLLGVGLARDVCAFTIFSTGMTVPESISEAPIGFGTRGGNYLIPDARVNTVWEVPHVGGAPSVFVNDPNRTFLGGLFLPAGWGGNSGNYLVVGETTIATGATGIVGVYDAAANPSVLALAITQLTTPAIAPAGFGTRGGQVFVTSQTGVVIAVDQAGQVSDFAVTSTDFSFRNFGIVFAPGDWGAVGGEMLVSNSVDGRIDAIDGLGTVTPFATIPTPEGQFGLRQMAFAPAGFLPGFGELLFVSVSGSGGGGGTLGDVVALDPSGQVVASLRTDLGLVKFDPRGLLFRADDSLLISDTSDPILLASSADFQPTATPAPSSLVLMVSTGFLAIAWRSRRRAAAPGRG
jgi:hypothetical protein